LNPKPIEVGRRRVLCQTIEMIKFAIQAEVDESKRRLKAELPETVRAASSPPGASSSKSKVADARAVRIKKPMKEIEGE
jgi:hypothetical protein